MIFRGLGVKIGGLVEKWEILGVTVENRGFSGKMGVFRKMGFSWVFGQEFREK